MVCQRPLTLGSHKNVMFWRCHSQQPLMLRKVVATRLSQSWMGVWSHTEYLDAAEKPASEMTRPWDSLHCNTEQSHQDFSYGDWRGGLVSKSTYCSSKGLKFSSHHPHLTVIPTPGNPTSSSGLRRHLHPCSIRTQTHTNKKWRLIFKIKISIYEG